jgi:plasmid replication DNA-binding protein KfrA
MTTESADLGADPSTSRGTFAARVEAMQLRVNDAARSLHDQGIRPTIATVRGVLGGGSPNDVAPALKRWRDSVLPGLPSRVGAVPEGSTAVGFPPMIADIGHELWQRAKAAAAVELKAGPMARHHISRVEEVQGLRNQVSALRDQLQSADLAYGELQASSTRHEVIAKEALRQVRDASARERNLSRELGMAKQRIVELQAIQASARRAVTRRRRPPPKRRGHRKRKTRSKAASSTNSPRTRRTGAKRPRSTAKRRR